LLVLLWLQIVLEIIHVRLLLVLCAVLPTFFESFVLLFDISLVVIVILILITVVVLLVGLAFYWGAFNWNILFASLWRRLHRLLW